MALKTPKPYFVDPTGRIAIYLGDSRKILPCIPLPEAAIVTDPIWPNASPKLVGHERPFELFREISKSLNKARRLALHFGCASDPRILASITLPYIRTCWMEYSIPGYSGRVLNGSEVVYTFGKPIRSADGRKVIPGGPWTRSNGSARDEGVGSRRDQSTAHPTIRPLPFVEWLVNWFSDEDETVIDPFMGSGTTALAARNWGRRFVGIEIEQKYCDLAIKRLAQQRIPFAAPGGMYIPPQQHEFAEPPKNIDKKKVFVRMPFKIKPDEQVAITQEMGI